MRYGHFFKFNMRHGEPSLPFQEPQKWRETVGNCAATVTVAVCKQTSSPRGGDELASVTPPPPTYPPPTPPRPQGPHSSKAKQPPDNSKVSRYLSPPLYPRQPLDVTPNLPHPDFLTLSQLMGRSWQLTRNTSCLG